MKDAMSTFSELTRDNFDTIIEDDIKGADPRSINKIVLLTGQAYYSVKEKMQELGRKV